MSQEGALDGDNKRRTKIRAVANAGDSGPQRAFSVSQIYQNTDWSRLPADILQHKISPHLETSSAREVCSSWADSILAPYIYLTMERPWDEDMLEELQDHFVCARGVKMMGLTGNKCISVIESLKKSLELLEGASSIVEFVFFRCNLGTQVAKPLAALLQHPKFRLETIRFVETPASVITHTLGEAFTKESPSIAKIFGAGASITTRSIAPALASNTSLVYVDLKRSAVNDEDGAMLASALQQNMTLSYLDLRDSSMTFAGIDALMECLGSNRGLRIFKLSSIRRKGPYQSSSMGETSGATAASLATNSTLAHLDLSLTPLSTEFYKHFADGLARNKTLKKLVLVDANCNSAQIKYLGPALAVHPSLEYLDLSRNVMNSNGGEPLTAALRENQSLKKLKLLETKGTEAFLFHLFNALCDKPNFLSLAISKGHVDNDVIGAFESLIDSETPLFHLELSSMFFKKPKDSVAIIDLITASTTIKSFKCVSSLVDGEEPRGYPRSKSKKFDHFDKLVEISAIPGLKKLHLDVDWTQKQQETFQKNVLQQTELERLFIQNLGIDNFLVDVLRALPSLQRLAICYSRSGEKENTDLIDAFKNSTSLKVLKARYLPDEWLGLPAQSVSLRCVGSTRDDPYK